MEENSKKPAMQLSVAEGVEVTVNWRHLVLDREGDGNIDFNSGRKRNKGEHPNATQCVITVTENGVQYTQEGWALLNPKDSDSFSYETGRKISLADALRLAFVGRRETESRAAVWSHYLSGAWKQ